jgi:cytochrome P450
MDRELTMPSMLTAADSGRSPDLTSRRLNALTRILHDGADTQTMRFGPFRALVLSEPKLARAVLVENADAFVKSYGLALFARPLLGAGLLTSEGEAHKRRRRMLSPVFSPRRIAGYAEIMVERAERSAREMLALGSLNVADAAMRLTLEIVAKTLFGTEANETANEFGAAVSEVLQRMARSLLAPLPMPPFVPTPNNLAMHAAVRRLDRIVYRVIEHRRRDPSEHTDLLDTLLSAKNDDGSQLSDRQIRDEAMTILVAGHETSANTLAWTLYLLARHPEVRNRLEREVDGVLGDREVQLGDLAALPYTLQVLKEVQRLYPPAYVVGRRARRSLTLDGQRQTVRRNQVVLINIMGMQRRAEHFAQPNHFLPERFDPSAQPPLSMQAYMPFGAGPRICIGNHFALMELQLILATWTRRMRFELENASQELACEPLITLRPRGGVIGRVTARA